MDPIQDIADLCSGDVVHHPALGFAVVDQVENGSAALAWETDGERLPPTVSSDLLAKGYRRCVPGGFLHRSVTDRSKLKDLVESEPTHAVRLLLDDLGESQGRSEIRDWLTARDLLSTVQFDRWWEALDKDAPTPPLLDWSDNKGRLAMIASAKPLTSEAFLSASPRERWTILDTADADTRIRLLHQAITARDTEAVLVVLRREPKVPQQALEALRQLARKGEDAIAAALLERGDTSLLKSLVAPSGHRAGQERVAAMVARLTPSRRKQVAVLIIEEALAIEGDPPAASWLCSLIPGGAQDLLAIASKSDDYRRATEWLSAQFERADTIIDANTELKTRDTVEFQAPFSVRKTAELIVNLRDVAPDRLLPISVGLSEALAHRHAQSEAGGIAGARIDATGQVELGPPEDRSRPDDVRDAMRLVLEAAVGPLPADVPLSDTELLPHINQLRHDLPVDWLAVLASALAEDPRRRPANGLALWSALARAQAHSRIRIGSPNLVDARLEVAHDTHIGVQKSRVMQTNQDATFYAQSETLSLLLVADGISVSTAGSGNMASSLLAQVLANRWETGAQFLHTCEDHEIPEWIDQTLVLANQAICDASSQLAGGDLSQQIPMGTTALVAVVRNTHLHLACLGDSRAYLIGESGVSMISGDQNVRGLYLVASKQGLPLPNVSEEGYALVGYCGRFDENIEPCPAPPVHRSARILPGETLLLCSDGLTDYAAGTMGEMNQMIADLATGSDLNTACRALVNAANSGGGGDNITVMLARLRTH